MAAQLPKPILIDSDRGADEVRVDRVECPKPWDDILGLLRAIGSEPGEYQSCVVDTADPIEASCIDWVTRLFKKQSFADIGNYGAGYEELGAQWRIFLGELDQIRAKGLIVCILAHSIVRQAQDPTLGEYDQFTAQLQKKTWALTQRWCDIVGFATFDAARVKDERRTIVSGQRILWTTRGTGFEAKNRYGLPAKLPLSWDAVEKGIAAFQTPPLEVVDRIHKLSTGTPFAAKAIEFIKEADGDVRQLLQIEEALKEKLAEAAKAETAK